MQRLVYAPKVNAWVKADSGIIDISPFIVAGSVNRKVGQVSAAQLTIRNPKLPNGRMLFTEGPDGDYRPLLHPMDPIIITLTRLRDRPIQVFTGYCDKTPYLQLYPGTVTIEASCTLKRLQYTFWDAGLPFTRDFLAHYGWFPNQATGGISNPKAETDQLKNVNSFNDGSIANLLSAVLQNVGGWDESTIYIEPLPPKIGPLVVSLFKQFQQEEKDTDQAKTLYEDLLTNLIGAGSFGTGGGSGTAALGQNPHNIKDIVKVVGQFASKFNLPPPFILAVMWAETSMTGRTDAGNRAHAGWFQMQNRETGGGPPYGCGPCSKRVPTTAEAENLEFALGCFCPAAVCALQKNSSLKNESNWRQWGESTQGASGQYASWASNLASAKSNWAQFGG